MNVAHGYSRNMQIASICLKLLPHTLFCLIDGRKMAEFIAESASFCGAPYVM
jgi:hypothetical protein